jgi:hypothetical protein
MFREGDYSVLKAEAAGYSETMVTFNQLRGVTSQKTTIFIFTAFKQFVFIYTHRQLFSMEILHFS